ncbi:hypothetical protein B0J15DRAFT_432677 [Fusarium solani]|uniref:Uncharacterized protein n=1 Tax=Fusarium solani TaxID=169388 RepID=A0A9P9JPF0_FUSSL|nr:uncharacterized protein B0J15DRAFT_432677 [Fusarium solani]KAH7232647.1 hypothetical protein B0J15DRAFT_432677 [Fusarium solani]
MELIHHYTTKTAATLSIRKDMAHLWQVTIPREGYPSPFVLHGILEMSAVHQAYLQPANQKMYLQLYSYHSALGSEQFRSTLEDPRHENWMGLFSFAALITLHAFTLPLRLNGEKLPDPLFNLFEVATLLRGIETMLSPMLPLISRSEFAPFIYGVRLADADDISARQVHCSLDNSHLPSDTLAALESLRHFLSGRISENCLPFYQSAVDHRDHLASLIALAGLNSEAGTVLGWLFSLPESLLPDIRERRPEALILVAYFSVFLLSLEKNFWYSQGWAKQVFEQILAQLIHRPRFLEALRWPRRVF